LDVVLDVRRPGYLRAIADRHVADDARVRAHDDKIAQLRRAGNPALGDNHAMATDDDVVGDLHEDVDLGSFADDRIGEGSSVDRSVGSDLNIITNYDTADLRHFHVPVATHGKAEPILPNTRAGMENHAVSDDRMGDGRAGTNVAITA